MAHFSYPSLKKSELTVVYSSAELKSKPVFDMIKKIIELDLQRCFPEVYRLCQLILTMPSTSASAERSFSAPKGKIGFQHWLPSQSRKNF